MSNVTYWKRFARAETLGPTENTLTIPAGTYVGLSWSGVSLMFAEFPAGNILSFSLLPPVSFPASITKQFILAVRWLIDDQGTVARYKIWDNDNGLLFFPVYDGEAIGAGAVFEFWNVNGYEEITIPDIVLTTSIFSLPNFCGCPLETSENLDLVMREPVTQDPDSACNPFCVCFLS